MTTRPTGLYSLGEVGGFFPRALNPVDVGIRVLGGTIISSGVSTDIAAQDVLFGLGDPYVITATPATNYILVISMDPSGLIQIDYDVNPTVPVIPVQNKPIARLQDDGGATLTTNGAGNFNVNIPTTSIYDMRSFYSFSNSQYYDCIVSTDGSGTAPDFNSIAAACAAMPQGASIFIKNGTYTETADIVVKNRQKLIAETKDQVIVDFGGLAFQLLVETSAALTTAGTVTITNGSAMVQPSIAGTFVAGDIGKWILIDNQYLYEVIAVVGNDIQINGHFEGVGSALLNYVLGDLHRDIEIIGLKVVRSMDANGNIYINNYVVNSRFEVTTEIATNDGIFFNNAIYNSGIINYSNFSGRYGVNFVGSSYNNFEIGDVSNSTDDGVVLSGASTNNTLNIKKIISTGYGLFLNGNTVTNNKIKVGNITSSDHLIYLENADYNNIEVSSISTGTASKYGIYLNGTTTNNIISVNSITTTATGYGIRLVGAGADDNTIKVGSITTAEYGVYLTNADNNIIEVNYITGTAKSAITLSGALKNKILFNEILTVASEYGINIISTSIENIIEGNRIDGVTGGGIYLDNSSKKNSIKTEIIINVTTIGLKINDTNSEYNDITLNYVESGTIGCYLAGTYNFINIQYITTGSTDYGLQITSTASYNNIKIDSITNVTRGLQIEGSYNKIEIQEINTVTTYGLYLTSALNNNISVSYIATVPTTALYMTGSLNNTIDIKSLADVGTTAAANNIITITSTSCNNNIYIGNIPYINTGAQAAGLYIGDACDRNNIKINEIVGGANNSLSNAVRLYGGDDNKIEVNYIYNMISGCNGIYIDNGAMNNSIRCNEISTIDGYGVAIDGTGVVPYDNEIFINKILNTSSAAIYVTTASRNKIHFETIADNDTTYDMPYGVYITTSDRIKIFGGQIVMGNRASGTDPVSGIYLTGVSYSSIKCESLQSNNAASYCSSNLIYLTGTSAYNDLDINYLSGTQAVALFVDSNEHSNNFKMNKIENFGTTAVDVRGQRNNLYINYIVGTSNGNTVVIITGSYCTFNFNEIDSDAAHYGIVLQTGTNITARGNRVIVHAAAGNYDVVYLNALQQGLIDINEIIHQDAAGSTGAGLLLTGDLSGTIVKVGRVYNTTADADNNAIELVACDHANLDIGTAYANDAGASAGVYIDTNTDNTLLKIGNCVGHYDYTAAADYCDLVYIAPTYNATNFNIITGAIFTSARTPTDAVNPMQYAHLFGAPNTSVAAAGYQLYTSQNNLP
ncbi:MAG: NosD domain-containing protein [Candidatus Paceibacterota bacterium]|jgi:hypothetical protein